MNNNKYKGISDSRIRCNKDLQIRPRITSLKLQCIVSLLNNQKMNSPTKRIEISLLTNLLLRKYDSDSVFFVLFCLSAHQSLRHIYIQVTKRLKLNII